MEELLPVVRPVLLVHVGEGDLQRAHIKFTLGFQLGDAGEDLLFLQFALLVAGKINLHLDFSRVGEQGILDVIKGDGFLLDDLIQVIEILGDKAGDPCAHEDAAHDLAA